MYISKNFALELFQAGFKKPEYKEEYTNYDFFEYNSEEWILGGSILPAGKILAPEEVYVKGTWLPSGYDLISWLEENDFTFNLSFNGKGYLILVIDSNCKEYKGKGATIEYALFNAIMKILKDYGGSPVDRKYEVCNAEYIGKDEISYKNEGINGMQLKENR